MISIAAATTAGPTAVHASIVFERLYPVSPARVFAAWSDREAKAPWSSCQVDYAMDFRGEGPELVRAVAGA